MSQSSPESLLAGCVSSLQASARLLDSSISILHSGVHDFPRIKQALQAQRHFELVSEPKLFAAQRSLADEIVPEVEHLLQRVEQYLAKLERREKSLISKVELQEGRLQQTAPKISDRPISRSTGAFGAGGGDADRAERLKMLQNKRERLEHTIERLSLQTTHKERQLRMSSIYNV